MAATGADLAKPPTLNPDRRAFGLSITVCQCIAKILRERLTNILIQDQNLQSLKSIFLETLKYPIIRYSYVCTFHVIEWAIVIHAVQATAYRHEAETATGRQTDRILDTWYNARGSGFACRASGEGGTSCKRRLSLCGRASARSRCVVSRPSASRQLRAVYSAPRVYDARVRVRARWARRRSGPHATRGEGAPFI